MSPFVEPPAKFPRETRRKGLAFCQRNNFSSYIRAIRTCGIFSRSCLFLAPNSSRSFIILIKVPEVYFYSFSFEKKSVMFPFYFIINVLEEFISTWAISTFNFIFVSLLILFLSLTLFFFHKLFSPLISFYTRMSSSPMLLAVPAWESWKISMHSITRNLCS